MTSNNDLEGKTLGKILEKHPTKINSFEEYIPEWITMSSIKPKSQPWFWNGMIPNDTITLFGGQGGIGKSLLLLYLAAKTTTGEKFNAGGMTHQLPKGSVILLSAEDDPEYQIKPKLIAAGADDTKIYHLNSKIGLVSKKRKFIALDQDLQILENKIIELQDVKFLLLDPIQYFTGETRDHYNSDVANFLQSLIDLCKKYHIAGGLNKHLRKKASGSKGNTSAADEVGGAGAWTNTPRRCWLITNDHEDSSLKIITKMKDNLGKNEDEALAYRIVPKTIEYEDVKIETTELVWEKEMRKISADEAVNEEKYEKTKMQYAKEFIISYLSKCGERTGEDVRDEAILSKITKTTYFDALNLLIKEGRVVRRDGFNKKKYTIDLS